MHSVPGPLFRAALLAASFVAVAPVALAAGHPAAGSPAAGSAPAATKAAAEKRAVLMAIDTHFSNEVAAKGFAAFDGFFADDAVYLPTFEPRVEGKKAIMESFRPLFDDHTIKLTWIPLRADVAASGELGWTTWELRADASRRTGHPARPARQVRHHLAQAGGRLVESGARRGRSRLATGSRGAAATPPAASKP